MSVTYVSLQMNFLSEGGITQMTSKTSNVLVNTDVSLQVTTSRCSVLTVGTTVWFVICGNKELP